MRMPEAGTPPGERWAAYLSVLVAACSLGLGGLGVVVLLKARSLPADAPRPYLYSERDRDAEKVIQRHNLTEWEILKQSASAGPTADARPRPDSVSVAATIPLLKDEQAEGTRGPRPEQHADNQRPTAPPTPPAKPNPSNRPSPPPAPAKPVPATDEVLRTYVTDGIADIRIDVKGMASRMAVAEADIKRMRKTKSLFEWFASVVACLAAIQGIAVLLLPFVARRRKLDIVQKQEAPPPG